MTVEKMPPQKMAPSGPIGEIGADMSHLDEMSVINPATEQVMTTTRKLWESIYRDKGFQLVNRDNSSGNNTKRTPAPKLKKNEPTSVKTASAAEIASKLGLKSLQENSPANDAESGVAAGDNAQNGVAGSGEPDAGINEIDANDNFSLASEPRPSSGRSR